MLLPLFFFLDTNNPCLELLFPHSHNLCKNTSVLGGTVLKNLWNGCTFRATNNNYTFLPYVVNESLNRYGATSDMRFVLKKAHVVG